MNGTEYFRRRKARISSFLAVFLEDKAGEVAAVRPWGREVVTRLNSFTQRGKMIRGGLVCLGYEMTGRRLAGDPVRGGAALELVQSALLIHDDIMDRDAVRRGEPSFHRVYAGIGRKERLSEPGRFGESMGICAGEIALFLAMEVLAGLARPGRRTGAALELVGREFVLVGLGQMQDIHAGAGSGFPRERDVLGLYKLKTARYSFSVPLALGCILAGGSRVLRRKLEGVGERFGLIFQLKDDDLGLFGEEPELGKPVGSDVRQGKKTLISVLLKERARGRDAAAFRRIYGNPAATRADVRFVRDLALRLGVRADVEGRLERSRRRAEGLVHDLPVDGRYKDILLDLLAFSLVRRK
jgi:geranylgeranyl diphosphate synthase type I